jgi:hypothetical protein
MKKGTVVAKWMEPREWRMTLLRYAKENPTPKPWTRFLPYLFAAITISAVLAWQWVQSDREGLISTLATVAVLAALYGLLHLFAILRLRFVATRVWIRENGIEMGELFGERVWTGFSDITGFFFDTDTIEGRSFRSLNWLPEGAQYPDSAVLQGEVDEAEIRALFISKGIEELEVKDE